MMFRAIMTFFASFGFGIIFDLKGKKLFVAAINGMIGGIMYDLLLPHSSSLALFVASFIVSIIAALLARVLKCPTTILLISALVPLVPGGMMYYTVLDLIKGDTALALIDGAKTLLDIGSIVFGCVVASGIELMVTNIKKKLASLS